MNRYAQDIINEFRSRENYSMLHDSIAQFFNQPRVFKFLNENLYDHMNHFAESMLQEMALSSPMPGVTMFDQLTCFNNQFIQREIVFIKAHVLLDDDIPLYGVKDDLPTSRRGLKHHQMHANDILKTWLHSPGRGVELREDTQGDISDGRNGINPYYSAHDNHLSTGIVFCDQRSLGTQNHVEQYVNTFYKQALNKGFSHESTPFGVSTPASDRRLLERRSFRRNEAGVENGIPRYESRLQNRYLERNIDEGLHNAEKGYKLHGHDLATLYGRVDHKNNTRALYEPRVQSHLKLHSTSSAPDEFRYF